MRYALLIYSDPATDPGENSQEADALFQAYMSFTEKWTSAGKIQGGEALQGIDTATTVQVRNGDTLTTDGPFAEVKEHLGGFYLVDAENLDEALSIAADIPTAQNGSIEVRPIMEFE
jgi:hypothetical protein